VTREKTPEIQVASGSRSVARSSNVSADTEEIRQFIDRWVSTLCEKKVVEHSVCYADQIDTYFNKKNVSNTTMSHDKANTLKAYTSLHMQVANLEIQSMTPSDAVVVFDKSWEAHGAKDFSGSEKQRLKLRRFGGTWKITSEEELKNLLGEEVEMTTLIESMVRDKEKFCWSDKAGDGKGYANAAGWNAARMKRHGRPDRRGALEVGSST